MGKKDIHQFVRMIASKVDESKMALKSHTK